jgi:superoxide reductase
MTELMEIYKCEVCGNITEVVNNSYGLMKCCEKPMIVQQEKTEDQGKEKHLPVIEKMDNGIKVFVGSVAHPMEEEHYIQWIEAVTESGTFRTYLKPGMAPEAEFKSLEGLTMVRSYCNLHGLWVTNM